jgi:pimeloyl-ACP methyl ester carboxylesterase
MTSYRQPGTVLSDLSFTIPLDHARPGGEQIQIFAREVVAADQAEADLPWLVYLQGGPGFGALRPAGRESWLNRALNDYRVLLLDQRGTGRSSPVNRRTLARLGSPPEQADYLARFRADPPGAHRGAPVEHPRPELRRLLRRHLPVARARGPARGPDHRRPARPGQVGR